MLHVGSGELFCMRTQSFQLGAYLLIVTVEEKTRRKYAMDSDSVADAREFINFTYLMASI